MISINRLEGEFSLVIIPDTQIMTERSPYMFKEMTQWIVDHAEKLQMKMVLHLGDVVDDGMIDEQQFIVAAEALKLIDESGIPMIIAPGNHDYDNILDINRNLTMFNDYFGMHRYDRKSWFGGTFEEGKVENCYVKLTINNKSYLFLALEFGPRDDVLNWVDELLIEHADSEVVIITHCYMFLDGTRNKPGDAHNPKMYVGAHGANDGEDQWQKCFRKHRNISAIYSGHQVHDHISYRIDQGDQGNLVFQSFQNWQTIEHGGMGRLRLAVYRPLKHRIDLHVINPQTGLPETEPGYKVSFPMLSSMDSPERWVGLSFP